MRKIIMGLIFVVAGLFILVQDAKAYMINDITLVQRSDNNSWVDVIGDNTFQIHGIDYSQIGNNLNIQIFTNYPQTGYTVSCGTTSWATKPGDFMIDVNLDNSFDYAIAMSNHSDTTKDDGEGIMAGQLFQVTTRYVSGYYNPGGYIYGINWKYDGAADATKLDAYVRANGTNILGTETVSWVDISGSDPNYRVDIGLNLSHFLPSGFAGDIGIYWASPTCANEAIAGKVTIVPEPGTWFMLGSGLLGLVVFGRRRRSHSS